MPHDEDLAVVPVCALQSAEVSDLLDIAPLLRSFSTHYHAAHISELSAPPKITIFAPRSFLLLVPSVGDGNQSIFFYAWYVIVIGNTARRSPPQQIEHQKKE